MTTRHPFPPPAGPAGPRGRRLRLAAVAVLTAAGTGLLTVAGTAAPADAARPRPPAAPSPDRGSVLSATPVAALTVADVRETLRSRGYPTGRVRAGVDGYRLAYRTVDVHGAPTVASGLLLLPRTRPGRLRTIVYEHGTRAARGDVASVSTDNIDWPAVVLLSAAGHAVAAPDYLGLGTGAGLHPYLDVRSEVTASLDLVRAARAFAGARGRPLADDLSVTGFSQGGPAAMALGRALQSGAAAPLRLAALAPVSGPYDLQHVELPAALLGRDVDPVAATFYLAYWLVAADREHDLYATPAEAFQAPYDRTVTGLFDGDSDEATVVAALPASPAALLRPDFVQRLRHPTGAVLRAIHAGDGTCRWQPAVPVLLVAARGDRQVPIENSTSCLTDLRRHGARTRLVDVGDLDHFPSLRRSMPVVLEWFDRR